MTKYFIYIVFLFCSWSNIIAQDSQQSIDNISKILFYGDYSNSAVNALMSFAGEVPEGGIYATYLQNRIIDKNDSVFNSTISQVKNYIYSKYGTKGDVYIRTLLMEILQKYDTCPDISLLDKYYKDLYNAIAASDFDEAKAYKWNAIVLGEKLIRMKFKQGEIQLVHHYNTIWKYLESNPDDTSLEYMHLCYWVIDLSCRGDLQPLGELTPFYNHAKKILLQHNLINTTRDYCLDLSYNYALLWWGRNEQKTMVSFRIQSLIDSAKAIFGANSAQVANGYRSLSNVEIFQGNKFTALSHMETSWEILSQHYNENNYYHQIFLGNLADLYIISGYSDYIEKGIDIYSNVLDTVEKLYGPYSDYYYELLLNSHISLSISNNEEEAYEILRDIADELLLIISDKNFNHIKPLKVAVLLRSCAECYFNTGQYEKAYPLIENSIELLSDLPNYELELAQSLLYNANFKSTYSQYKEASDLYIKIAQICQKYKYREMAISYYCDALYGFKFNNNISEATKVIKILEQQFPEALNSLDYLMSKSAILQDKAPDQALNYLNKALLICKNSGDVLTEAICYYEIGNIYYMAYKNCTMAREYLIMAKNIYQTFNERTVIDNLIATYKALSNISSELSDFNNARKYMMECVALCERNEMESTITYFSTLIFAANYFKEFGNIPEMGLYMFKAGMVANNIITVIQDKTTTIGMLYQVLPLMLYVNQYYINNQSMARINNYDIDLQIRLINTYISEIEQYFENHNIRDTNYQGLKFNKVLYYQQIQDYESAQNELNELISILPSNEYFLRNSALLLRAEINAYQQHWDLVISDLLLLCEQCKGTNLLGYSNLLYRLGYAYLQNAEYDNAINCAQERFLLNRDFIDSKFNAFTSFERSAISGFSTLINPLDFYSLLHYSDNPDVCSLSYDAALYYKGRLTRTEKYIRQSIISSNDSSLIADYNRMLELQKEYLLVGSKTDSVSLKRQVKLVEEASIIDNRIATKSVEYMKEKNKKNITWQDVSCALKNDEVAIEFVQYPIIVNESIPDFRYGALILRNTYKAPEFVPLMRCSTLDSLRELKSGSEEQYINRTYRRTALVTSPRNGAALYDGIWASIEQHLDGVNKVYYSPIGHLYTLAFSALEDSTGLVLSEKYDLRMVTNTAQIINPNYSKDYKISSASIIGGIIYDADTTKQAIRNRNWKELEYSFKEMSHLPSSFRLQGIKTDSIAGLDATEESFRNLSNNTSNIIHISTHGFYRDSTLTEWTYIYPQTKPSHLNSMNRSALVMADANPVWNGEEKRSQSDDGILTASEIAELDLSKCSIVLLGACETGLGMPNMNEGVDGLQRGFKLAGAQTVIMSLWSVNDKAESEFVSIFYDKLFNVGLEKHIAFREAQLELKQKYPRNPFKWAYFVMLD